MTLYFQFVFYRIDMNNKFNFMITTLKRIDSTLYKITMAGLITTMGQSMVILDNTLSEWAQAGCPFGNQ